MKLMECNPFVRHIKTNILTLQQPFLKAYDQRMYYLSEGTLTFRTIDEEFIINPQTLIYFPSAMEYSFTADSPVKLTTINFDFLSDGCDITEPMISCSATEYDCKKRIESFGIEDADFFNDKKIIENAETFYETIKKIEKEFTTHKIFCREKTSALFKILLTDLARFYSIGKSDINSNVEKVILYIQNNFEKNISNTELAKLVNYHPYHLNRLMLKYTGKTCRRYLLDYRLERAREMLIEDKLSINEIASSNGFESHSHFSHYFKLKTGVSPFEYRKKYKNMM